GWRTRGARAPRLAVAALVVLALAGGACGDDDDSDSGGGLSATTEPGAPGTTTGPGQEPLADIELTLTEVASAEEPTALVTRPGSDALYVAEKAGVVRELTVTGSGAERTYQLAEEPLLDISDDVTTDGE